MSYIEIQPTFSHLDPNRAQWLERLTVDLKVVGLSPAWELRYFYNSIIIIVLFCLGSVLSKRNNNLTCEQMKWHEHITNVSNKIPQFIG